MTAIPAASLRGLPAFRSLSEEALSLINDRSKILRYQLGQTISDRNTLPADAIILLDGEGRLLAREGDRLVTVGKIQPGSIIGLASLLRGYPCEDVTATCELSALAIPDECIAQLYENETSFREWCQENLWVSELIAVIQAIQARSPHSAQSLQWLQEAQESCKLVKPTEGSIQELESSKHQFFAIDPKNPGSYGMPLSEANLDSIKPEKYESRVIRIPTRFVELVSGLDTTNEQSSHQELNQINLLENTSIAPARPPRSKFNQNTAGNSKHTQIIRGIGPIQETLACFKMLATRMDLPFRSDSVEKILQDVLRRGQQPNLQICGQIAASLGLHVIAAKVPTTECTRLKTPALIEWDGGFVLVTSSSSKGLELTSPKSGLIEITQEEFCRTHSDRFDVLLLDRTDTTPEQRFGFEWFVPALKRYRGVLTQVLIASFVVQLFTLANPLLIQVIIDKVISQRSLDTLQVLGFALVVLTLLEGILGSLRTFLFAETTNRIDQRLGAEVIDHLLRLPLWYFDKRPVGELGTRIGELEKIRNFLTGQALTTILDAIFSLIYIVVMAMYSWILTAVALAVLPIQIGLTLLGAPLFRRQFRQAAEENARTQSHLVEVLTGIQTVKAQNVEMVSRWKWQEFYSKFISRSYEKTITGTALSQTSQVLQKLSQLLVLWVGAGMVLQGNMTLGQLIAFRIISGYVTQPLLRLSSIWQNIQELKVSFERLADVINTPLESNTTDQAKIPLPPIGGKVNFEDLTFSFNESSPAVLKSINLSVDEGTFVGIVGQSGSGKSTLMKLLPRLYKPNLGKIKIDEYDIDKVELYSLRRQIGIVPQDPLLFSGTISENIALTQPDATSDDIVKAARLACAHEFIMQLPSGYSTPVGERGSNLSGGQRQRIAIARTLLSKPKLLIMDEATSALDYDTERRVCNNLLESLEECTVFFITHRLSTIRKADRIVMMHQGAIVEQGTHEELVNKRGRYFALYKQQEASQ